MSTSSSSPTAAAKATAATSNTLRQIPIVCPGHSRPLAELQYSASSAAPPSVLISACHDKLPMLRRADTGDWIGTFEGHKGAVWSAALDPVGQLAASGSADFSAKLWDAHTGQVVATLDHKHVVKSVVFTSDGQQLLTAGHERVLRVFDLATLRTQWAATTNSNANANEGDGAAVVGDTAVVAPAPVRQMTTKEQIRKVVVLPGDRAVTGEVDGTLTVWHTGSGQQLATFKVDAGVMDLEASRDGTILTVAAGKKVHFFDVAQEFALLRAVAVPVSFSEEGGASLHPHEDKFIAGGSDTWVRVLDFQSGALLETHKGHHGPVRCLRYAPSGDSFATGSEDGTIRIWQSDSASAAAASVSEVTE